MLRSNTLPLMPAVLLAALTCAMWLESRALAKEFLVTSLEDAGKGSLRAAVKSANECPGSDLISFKKQLRGTIELTTGQIEITDDLKLAGPGEFRLTVSGNHRSRIFRISKDVSVSIEDLAIVDGMNTVQESIGINVTRGGAILNDGGTLNVLRVTFRDNVTINVTTDEVDSDVTGAELSLTRDLPSSLRSTVDSSTITPAVEQDMRLAVPSAMSPSRRRTLPIVCLPLM